MSETQGKAVFLQAKFSTVCYFLKNSVAVEGKLFFYSKKFKKNWEKKNP